MSVHSIRQKIRNAQAALEEAGHRDVLISIISALTEIANTVETIENQIKDK